MALNFRFIFRGDIDPASDLEQGDVLLRNDALVELLREPHGYYSRAHDYSHFIVLTQSCDLVRYGYGIKSQYITIAALRPFSKFVEKIVARSDCSRAGAPIQILKEETRGRVRNQIEHLLHYDLPGYFFVPEGALPSIDVPLVAFLQLAISIKPEHYQPLLDSRVGKLTDVFSAKLGWLTGNQYSRVATRDIDEENGSGSTTGLLKELFTEYVEKERFWLTSKRLQLFEAMLAERLQSLGVAELSKRQALDLASEVPVPIDEVAEIVAKLADQLGAAIPGEKIDQLKSQIRNNRRLKILVSPVQT